MNVRRNWLFFLVMLVLAACCILLLAAKPITQAVHTIQDSPEGCVWQAVGAGGGKTAAAAGWRDGKLVLRYFTTDGKLLSEESMELPEEMEGASVAKLLPVRDGYAYVGLYGPNAEKLYLYRFITGEEAERLLALSCTGESFSERISRTELSELTCEDDVLSFAVRSDRKLELYRCRETGGLEPAGTAKCAKKNVLSVCSAENGTLLVGGCDALSLTTASDAQDGGKSGDALVRGQAVTHLTQGRGGWYYVDGVHLDLCFVDASLTATQRMLRLDTLWKDVPRTLTSLALTREESALMLLDGSILTVTDGEGTRELTGILYAAKSKALVTLLGFALIALAVGAALWLLLCGLRRGYASLVVFRGSIFVAAALVCFTVLYFVCLIPMQRASALEEKEALVMGVFNSLEADGQVNDADNYCRMLEGSGALRNVRAVFSEDGAAYSEDEEGTWRLSDLRLATMDEAFSPTLLESARAGAMLSSIGLEWGSASELRGGLFRCALWEEGRCLSILAEDASKAQGVRLVGAMLLCFLVLACLALLILLSVGVDLRRISKKMEDISRGGVPERLALHTGDELESMATTVNSMGASLKAQEEARESLEHSYRRFVPEKVLALLTEEK